MSDYTEEEEELCPDCDGQGIAVGSDRMLLCARCDMTGEITWETRVNRGEI